MMLRKKIPHLTGALAFAILAANAHASETQGLGETLSVVDHLAAIAIGLFVIVLTMGIWGWNLRSKLRRQTADMSAHSEHTQRSAQLEAKRSRILEEINSPKPLNELVKAITEMVAFSLDWPFCWCVMTSGSRLGNAPGNEEQLRTIQLEIPAGVGGSLGTMFAATEAGAPVMKDEAKTLEAGVQLATIAIETRKLYKDIGSRSEFDSFTEIHNRLSLERCLDEQIETAKRGDSIFGLVYIDLDEFTLINDFYGHRIGDLYLQEVSLRMKRQLRSGDILAWLGSDEFVALAPVVRSRAALEEIAQRLERCFDAPFAVEGNVLRGGASVGVALYPEDGTAADTLLSAADAAMYVAKQTKRHQTDMPGKLQDALFKPEI